MPRQVAYDCDLAYVHDVGFGHFAEAATSCLLQILASCGGDHGKVVDLGCGSGIWARRLVEAGYDVVGVDLSPAMIELARSRVPQGEFHSRSFVDFDLPQCQAVTAIGEVLNYTFDRRNSLRALERLARRVHDALRPRGVFIFDLAEPGRSGGQTRSFWEGDDWACLVEYGHDSRRQRLTRRIVTFRKSGAGYRRHEEMHTLQLYHGAAIAKMLRRVGFRVRTVRRYGAFALPPHVVGIVARKVTL